jgi:hypothetical protein
MKRLVGVGPELAFLSIKRNVHNLLIQPINSNYSQLLWQEIKIRKEVKACKF